MQRINFFQLFVVKSNAPLEKKEKMVGTWVHSLVPKIRGLGGGGRVTPNLKE